MDEAQAPVVRRRRTRVEAEQLVAEYEASDMGRQEFCRKHGLGLVTLDRYRRRLRKAQSVSSGQGRWLAVELSGHQQANPQGAWSGLALILTGGKRIEVAAGFDARTLQELVRALESF
jgi:transposase-like protein